MVEKGAFGLPFFVPTIAIRQSALLRNEFDRGVLGKRMMACDPAQAWHGIDKESSATDILARHCYCRASGTTERRPQRSDRCGGEKN